MKLVDLNSYRRKEIYNFNRGMSNPFYVLGFNVDVTEVYEYVKKEGLSFYYAFIWLCTEAINMTEEFHYVLENEELYYLEQRHPSFTDMKKDDDLFYIVTLKHQKDIKSFCQKAKETSARQNHFIDLRTETNNLIYFTCVPWLELTALTNERDLLNPKAKEDCIPRIGWGRYFEENGRKKMNISIEVNHILIDGIHINYFYQNLCKLIKDLK
ncbi:MAG TPA: CatA-like O-acetyltransferase [Erysipelotrichaceae bacterium]|nr:CatA-like O-acetyltransferase [Erysipelotrichaceae bacterium]